MLQTLYVENYALIDKLELKLSGGLNIITGETGAGKSILLGALGLLLGNRSETGLARDGERNCIVEGTFGIDGYGLEGFFEDNDLDYQPSTVIRRVITPAGKSRAYVNDLPVQLTVLKELGTVLIDIHSQHQNLSLADEGFRTKIVDAIVSQPVLAERYAAVYRELRATERELSALREEASKGARDEEYLRHQCEELAAARLRDGEQEELEAELSILANAGRIGETLSEVVGALDEEETGILARLKNSGMQLRKLEDAYPAAAEFAGRIHSAMLELKDLLTGMEQELGRIEADPEKLQRTDERLGLLYSLQQKHRAGSVAGLISLYEDYGGRLATIVGAEAAIATKEIAVRQLTEAAGALADEITVARRQAAGIIKHETETMLAGLGIPGARLEVEITQSVALRSSGRDVVRFLFSATKDNSPQPAEKVASGGELSRLMLSVKSLVSRYTQLPTIIFDEIDSGVSGRIADAMGAIISTLAANMQVVTITHLPQVASRGESHWVVYKEEADGRTRTMIRPLAQEERIDEIAKMLSGSTVTSAAIEQARLLLGRQ